MTRRLVNRKNGLQGRPVVGYDSETSLYQSARNNLDRKFKR